MDILIWEKALNTVKTLVTLAAFINVLTLAAIVYRLFKKQSMSIE